MFRGITAIQLDAKGRMAIPSRYRVILQAECDGQVVTTIDTESRCQLMYPRPHWEEIEQKLQRLPSFNPATRRIQRLLIGHAQELEMDKQGRILLPPLLRDYAALEKSTMLVGQGNKFEIWAEDQWQTGRDTWLQDSISQGGDVPPELSDISL
jgi:MraZ protein